MPLPNPRPDEPKADFITRCMNDDQAKEDFPDNDQRFAVCNRIWEEPRSEMDAKEIRTIDATELRVERRDDEAAKIIGYAAVFDTFSLPMFGFREKIAKGAFKKTLKAKDDVRALVDHEPTRIIGRTKSGTLSLREDDVGLLAEIDPPDTQTGRDIVTSIERGDVSGMSFAFRTIKETWEEVEGEDDIRTINQVELFDVSPVTYPAYPDTSVAVRSRDAWKAEATPEPEYRPSIEHLRRRLTLGEIER